MKFATYDINLATFIDEMKGFPSTSNIYDDDGRLIIEFNELSEEQANKWEHEYKSSQCADCNAKKMFFIKKMRRKS